MAKMPGDDLRLPGTGGGLPVPNMGGTTFDRPPRTRPPAVMGPSMGTNGRPPGIPPLRPGKDPMRPGGPNVYRGGALKPVKFPGGQNPGPLPPPPGGHRRHVRPSDSQTAGPGPNSPYRLPGPPPAPLAPEAPQPMPQQPAQPPAPAPSQAPGTQPAAQPQTGAPGAVLRPQMVVGSTAEVPAGIEVDTQHGRAYKDPASGRTATKLNSAGKAAYQRAAASQLQRFGSYYGSDDPNHPKPPIEPGVPMFNPDTGQWIE